MRAKTKTIRFSQPLTKKRSAQTHLQGRKKTHLCDSPIRMTLLPRSQHCSSGAAQCFATHEVQPENAPKWPIHSGRKGEYHRLKEARVALGDETDKIRFIDKQIDTFQAATELAHSKGWHAILVTGTEQFRREAWYRASLTGLKVVGYEATATDLENLAAAQERRAIDQAENTSA